MIHLTLSFKNFLWILLFMMSMHRARASNLTSITWSHATNSQQELTEVLDSEINFIEADIVYGYLLNDTSMLTQLPIMAHPPNITSDISLQEFLRQIWDFNSRVPKEKQKGVKLDFKSTEVFQSSLAMLNTMWNDNYEIWLNADIYSGPVNNNSTLPVNPNIFLLEAKKFANATLSTGWTTRWGSDYTEGSYMREQIDAMINGIQINEVKNPLTFPVRAGIAANSIDELSYLHDALKNSNKVTFTIWSSVGDYVDVEGLRKMIFYFGIDKVYIDVPDALYNQLQLDNDPYENGAVSFKPTFVMGVLVLIAVIGHLLY